MSDPWKQRQPHGATVYESNMTHNLQVTPHACRYRGCNIAFAMLLIPPPGTPSRVEIHHIRGRVRQGHLYRQRRPSRWLPDAQAPARAAPEPSGWKAAGERRAAKVGKNHNKPPAEDVKHRRQEPEEWKTGLCRPAAGSAEADVDSDGEHKSPHKASFLTTVGSPVAASDAERRLTVHVRIRFHFTANFTCHFTHLAFRASFNSASLPSDSHLLIKCVWGQINMFFPRL